MVFYQKGTMKRTKTRWTHLASASVFLPSTLAALEMWLKGDPVDDMFNDGVLPGASDWLDQSANSNDGEETSSSEQPHIRTDIVANKNAPQWDSVNDSFIVASHSSIDDIFSGGATIFGIIYPFSDGEANGGRVMQKYGSSADGWLLYVREEAAGFVKLAFQHNFSTTDGNWRTTNAVVPISEASRIIVTYDSDSASNTPTFIINGTTYTFGSGIENVSGAASGTADSDATQQLVIGNNDGHATTWHGLIPEIGMYSEIKTGDDLTNIDDYLKRWTDVPTITADSDILQVRGNWRADMGITHGTGDNVDTVADQSGGGNALRQTTDANRPEEVDDGGMPAIDHNGVDQFMTLSAFSQGTLEQPNTIYMVIKPDTRTGAARSHLDGFGGTNRHYIRTDATPNYNYASMNIINTGVAADSDYVVLAYVFEDDRGFLYRNGTLISGRDDVANQDLIGLTVGALNGGGSQFAQMRWRQIMVVSGAHDANTVKAVSNMLEDRYSIS